jgi:lysophospholipase L1-like esterase
MKYFKPSEGISAPLPTSRLSGKKWVVVGDSITEKNSRATKNYHDFIKDWTGCTVVNHGISGTGWFTPSTGGGTNSIRERIGALPADADFVTVFAGTNDWSSVGKPFVLGTIADTDGAVSFYGAVNSVITQLIAKYPTKPIAVFTPLPKLGSQTGTKNVANVTMKQVAEVIIEVCSYFSIPVLNLYSDSGLYPWDATNNATYFSSPGSPTGDGLHPNAEGQLIMARKIMSFFDTKVLGTSDMV